MEKTILTIAIAVLSALMLCLMYRVVKGPRFTDRILAVNAINTMITAVICLLGLLVLVFGMYGIGFNASEFIYSRF